MVTIAGICYLSVSYFIFSVFSSMFALTISIFFKYIYTSLRSIPLFCENKPSRFLSSKYKAYQKYDVPAQ